MALPGDLVERLGQALIAGLDGLSKRDYVEQEIDANAMDLMRAIKRQFDRNGILDAGKVLPPLTEPA